MPERIAIRAQNLGKHYRLGEMGTLAAGLRDWFRRTGRNAREESSGKSDEFWALRDVSFTLKPGETLGIIGQNGAGKSTLLKILSRITYPTEGRAEIHGRVGSLLEVGTGFNPELTGRENIYLNGAILGMTKREIDAVFDEIVAFSGVERFLDTPVKRYSSGMRVRLGFAVAAHLRTEILIVDEVLAVGDSVFRSKCIGKMDGIAREGRTVLFVSHNMQAINNLCSRCLWLEEGRIVRDGPTEDLVFEYLRKNVDSGNETAATFPEDPGIPHQIVHVGLYQEDGSAVDRPLTTEEPFFVELRIRHREKSTSSMYGAFYISDGNMQPILFTDSRDHEGSVAPSGSAIGEEIFRVRIEAPLLTQGKYWFTAGLREEQGERLDLVKHAVCLEIVDIDGSRPNRPGYINRKLEWSLREKHS